MRILLDVHEPLKHWRLFTFGKDGYKTGGLNISWNIQGKYSGDIRCISKYCVTSSENSK